MPLNDPTMCLVPNDPHAYVAMGTRYDCNGRRVSELFLRHVRTEDALQHVDVLRGDDAAWLLLGTQKTGPQFRCVCVCVFFKKYLFINK